MQTRQHSRHPPSPLGEGPALEWLDYSWKYFLFGAFSALVALIGGQTLYFHGVSWVVQLQEWFSVAIISALFGGFCCWNGGGVAAGADWLRNREDWVKIYELVEVKITFPHDAGFGITRKGIGLALKDSDGRALSVLLAKVETNTRLWNLVFNGIMHSVESGAATLDERTGDVLIHSALTETVARPLPAPDPAVAEHRAAVTAHHSGDHDVALKHYQRSLLVAEELGDSAGVARASQALGILLTEVGDAESAIGFTLQSLVTHNDLDVDVDGDLRWLARQRRILGKARFAELLSDSLGESAAGELTEVLDELPAT